MRLCLSFLGWPSRTAPAMMLRFYHGRSGRMLRVTFLAHSHTNTLRSGAIDASLHTSFSMNVYELFLMSIQEHDSCCFYVSRNVGIVSATVIQWRCVWYGNDDY